MDGKGDLRNLAEQVLRSRTRLELEQEDLARLMGVNLKTVQRIESGQQGVAKATLIKLGDALNWPSNGTTVALQGGDPMPDGIPAAVAAQLKPLLERSAEIQRKLNMVQDVYDDYGRDAARAALARLSAEFAELQAQMAALMNGEKASGM